MSAISFDGVERGPSFGSALFLTGFGLRLLCAGGLVYLGTLAPLALPVLAAALATDLFAFFWQLVRFNAASVAYFNNTGRFWQITAGYLLFLVMAIAMLTQWWLLYDSSELAQARKAEAANMALHGGPKVERFKMTLSKDRKSLEFTGVVSQGTLDDLVPIFNRVPELETLVLNSAGGNLYAAREMAQEVMARGLNTHVERECGASCTLVFAAGRERTMNAGAELGFHRYGLDFLQLLAHVKIEEELPKDRQYFLGRGINSDFIERAFDLEREALWAPGRRALFNAGVLTQP
ncbi:hypothetical protein N6L24_09960 [Cognatishimia sp. SS12]|uniref:hypothetical protein n=1 Tax=Cognatishimia sp. SS12 TaxID=2979465 RepID=UPI002330BEDE|nr:hypothetical protein [Cognatishimia sp. SS12]MDC0738606.1 hypothetical protein [Cognatishimia sp. SS12]